MGSLDYRSPRDLIIGGKLLIPEVFEWNAKENPNLAYFRYHGKDGLHTITYAHAIQAIRRAARYVYSCVGTVSRVVAVIANTDTITYALTSLGILRSGHTMFLISPRNVPAAVVDMLRKTGCKDILVSQDTPVQDLVKIASKDLANITLHRMPVFADLFPPKVPSDQGSCEDLPKEYDPNGIALLLHSSGSTNHPKPIQWTHKRMVKWASASFYGTADLTLAVTSVHGTPMFHAIGVLTLCQAANHGMTLTAFPPCSPPIFPTSDNVFDGLVKTSSSHVKTAPAFVEMWARDPEKIAYMKQMKAVIFGGAPLNPEVGDALAAQGVTLWSLYGSTEIGAIARFFPDKPGKDWSFFEFNPLLEIVMVPAGTGRYELVVLSPVDSPLPLVNMKVGDRDAYNTNDILVPHPTKPGMWKYYGRFDDQIVLSNGEKAKEIINEDPRIHACVMFGEGKFQNGVLIEPKDQHKIDPRNFTELQRLRNEIWSAVELANDVAPQHSRIFKEMILITSPTKPFTYNLKGYPRRKLILEEYHDEIENIYIQVEQSTQSDVAVPLLWIEDNARVFLRTVIHKVIKRPLLDDADFFRNGCDSLQATWIRNTIMRAAREHSPTADQRVPMNIVYQAPTIASLTTALLQVIHDTSAISVTSTSSDLVRIAEQYSSDLPSRPSQLRPRESAGDVVVVTGTTGGFGCDILEHLLRDTKVAKVYAFNRPGSKAMERQRARFRERGLEEYLLNDSKFTMVEAALDVPGFGLSPELLDEIRGSLTHIMHNAWTVNFNLTLPSFAPDLQAVRNLVELSLSSPFTECPKIQLVSSVGVFEHCTIPPPVPEVALDPSSALGSGYTESKWIAERILQNVAERAAVPIVVVRLGQVSGDRTGRWNEREWFPALVKSAQFTRCLPDVEGSVSFVLGYPAARAFVEMRDSRSPILHLVHPRPVAWRSLIEPIAAELQVPVVPYPAWLAALERTAVDVDDRSNVDNMRENPALHLLDFFRSRACTVEGRDSFGLVRLSTEKVQSVSETLARMPELSQPDTMRWVAAWQGSGFLKAKLQEG